MTDTIEARVVRGAALLDETLPGWVERIDLDNLALDDECDCVLGQTWDGYSLSSPFDAHMNELGLLGSEGIEHGFDVRDPREYEALTAEWKRLVEARRSAS